MKPSEKQEKKQNHPVALRALDEEPTPEKEEPQEEVDQNQEEQYNQIERMGSVTAAKGKYIIHCLF